tara:strand:+ start:344 stop:460 length:117 start_codon:yes stop_codon:yes gene_type:complete
MTTSKEFADEAFKDIIVYSNIIDHLKRKENNNNNNTNK